MLRTLSLSLLLISGSLFLAYSEAHCEEIPLETCDRLPVVWASISGMKFLFLVDTAATSMLNLKSFAHGDSRRLAVSSWSGTTEIDGQDVVVGDLAIGRQHLKNIHLHAVDLSAIGRACGRRIDGILGIDLLGKLGATVDLKNHVARLPQDSTDAEARAAELHQQLVECEQAFNRADESAFADCLDPQIVVFAASGDYYGRESAMEYYRGHYFQTQPPAQLSITPRAHHAIGDAMWVEYDMRITMGERTITARGTALCEKQNGKWRIVHLNHSAAPGETLRTHM
jgi:ketosteroid isomerase-like protein